MARATNAMHLINSLLYNASKCNRSRFSPTLLCVFLYFIMMFYLHRCVMHACLVLLLYIF